jgi:hypothetical protein
MEQGKTTNLFPNYLLYEFQGLSGGRIWKAEHDLLLLKGILKYVSVAISLCYDKLYKIIPLCNYLNFVARISGGATLGPNGAPAPPCH